jgi:Ferritin-like
MDIVTTSAKDLTSAPNNPQGNDAFAFAVGIRPATRLLPAAVFDTKEESLTGAPVIVPKPADLSWWDWAVFLLHTVTEIEHALLVEYLYAAYSLRTGLSGVAAGWRSTIVGIARQEMGHLLTEQNILRFIGAPLNFEREDFPFRSHLYPFRFGLEPISKNSLAKYVAAEMPATTDLALTELDEILTRAAGADQGTPVNRVGMLFDTLVDIFADPTRLHDTDFRPTTADDLQGRPDDWNLFGDVIVDTITSRDVARDALSAIGNQGGEGSGATSPPDQSHFDKFLTIYRAFPEDASNITRSIPSSPNTLPDPMTDPAMEQGRITEPTTFLWAQLFNVRYRALLLNLAHSLHVPGPTVDASGSPTLRGHLTDWTFDEMRNLKTLASVLTRKPLKQSPTPPGPTNAGPPFELPFTLSLADNERDRWREHLAVLDNAAELITSIDAVEGANPTLAAMAGADAETRVIVNQQLSTP